MIAALFELELRSTGKTPRGELSWPLAGDLCVQLVYDFGEHLSYVDRELAETWGQSDAQLRETALANLATLPRARYENEEKALQFYSGALHQLRNAPGIKAAGLTTSLPFGEEGNSDNFIIEGQQPATSNASGSEQAEVLSVTPGVFQALGIPLLLWKPAGASGGPIASSAAGATETCTESWCPW